MKSPLFNTWLKYTNAYSTKYPQEKSTVIEALTRTFGDINVAMMLHKAKTTDATRNIAKQFESAQREMWLSSGKYVDDVLELLDLRMYSHFTGDPLLNTWVSYMDRVLKENPGQATTLLTTLETHFHDKALNQILLATMKFPSMEKAAITIQTEKIQGYLANNRSPYVTMFNRKNPKHQESWFTAIRMEYNAEPVKRMIKTAMNDPSTVEIAKLMERERSKHWLDEKDPPRDVFHFLDLDKIGEQTLASSNFKVWAKYLNDFNHRYPKEKTTMIDGLKDSYPNWTLVEMFAVAKKDPSTEKLATNLQSALIHEWEKPADLKWTLDGVPTSDEMIARYVKKLEALSGNTS